MNKKLLKIAICTAVTVAFAVPAFANPFADVPKNHWAYDAVNKLVADGIVDGYGDGTFRGDKTITRYEMAQIVAKAMGKVSTVDEKVVVDKLAAEFGQELNDMGVKVDSLQKQMDEQIKFSGDARAVYVSDQPSASKMDYRFRLGATGKINDNMKANVRLTTGDEGSVNTFGSPAIDRFNVEANVLGMHAIVGKQGLKLGQGLLVDTDIADGADHSITGATVQVGNLVAAVDNTKVDANNPANFRAAQYTANILGRAVTADYLDVKDGDKYVALSSDFNLGSQKIDAEVVKNTTQDAYGYKVGTNILGAQVSYVDYHANALPALSGFDFGDKSIDDKGFQVTYSKEIAKNTNLAIDYKNLDHAGDQTKVMMNVKF